MQQFSNQEIAELKSRVDQLHELLANRGEHAGGFGDEAGAAMFVMAMKSVDASYGILALMAGLAAVVDTVAMPR